jgi:ABC-type Na+ efflux pump permease subunit
MGLIDIVFVKLAPVSFMTLIAAFLWIIGAFSNSGSLSYDGTEVFIVGIFLQVIYLTVRYIH